MAKSVVGLAIEHIDAQIADLNRAREILKLAQQSTIGSAYNEPPKPRKPRGPNKQKRGLPAEDPSL